MKRGPVLRPHRPAHRRDRDAGIRLVAIDLDGTLLDDTKQISLQTAKALACLPARDVKVVIASARPPRSVRHIYHALKLDTLQINYNGALIWDERAGLAVFHRPMNGKLVRALIDAARAQFDSVVVTCEILDRWYTDRFDQPYTTETGKLFKPDVVAALHEICAQPITKLVLLADPRAITQLETTLEKTHKGKAVIVRTDPQLIQIMDKRVSKAAALKMVAAHYDVPMQRVMAIGDAPNDVGMLQLAGVAVAMDNAYEIVKQTADWVAPSNNDHGVHAALVKYGLCD
jgi:hypothetical protein